MNEVIFQIYVNLLLTLTGLVLPILTIAISFFPEGIKLLAQDYENKRKQAEKNLEEELKKKTGEGIDYDVLSKNIALLKSTKRKASRKLSYLNPMVIISRSAIALSISFASFFIGLFLLSSPWLAVPCGLFILSVCSLIWAVFIFWNSIEIIIEASSVVQNIKKQTEEKTLELLTAIVDNSKQGDQSIFIKPGNIEVFFAGEKVISNKKYVFSTNKEHSIKISLKNLSDYMLKTAELGFTFPAEFLVKETTNISSVYTGEKEKIIRFKHNYLQSSVNQLEGDIYITFLKVGVFNVDTFVKGENLKNKIIKFKIEVIE